MNDAFGSQPIEIRLDVIEKRLCFVSIFHAAKALDHCTHAAAMKTILCAPLGILTNSFLSRFVLGHNVFRVLTFVRAGDQQRYTLKTDRASGRGYLDMVDRQYSHEDSKSSTWNPVPVRNPSNSTLFGSEVMEIAIITSVSTGGR